MSYFKKSPIPRDDWSMTEKDGHYLFTVNLLTPLGEKLRYYAGDYPDCHITQAGHLLMYLAKDASLETYEDFKSFFDFVQETA